ncbi:MAG: hypothetical protein ACRYHA_31640 [Janthinobacterium lividum]
MNAIRSDARPDPNDASFIDIAELRHVKRRFYGRYLASFLMAPARAIQRSALNSYRDSY